MLASTTLAPQSVMSDVAPRLGVPGKNDPQMTQMDADLLDHLVAKGQKPRESRGCQHALA